MKGYKICSWDVGIKHLAFCVMEATDQEPHIIDWGVINLLEDDKVSCDMLHKKTGKKCDKNALFSGLLEDGTTKNYCGVHKSDHPGCPFDWSDTHIKEIKDQNSLCVHSVKNNPCGKKAKFMIDEKPTCTTHKTQEVNRVKKSYQLLSLKKKSSYATNPQILATRMYQKLDENNKILEVDEVLIENQPTLMNPTMKTVSSFLFSYFAIRGVVDKKDSNMKIRFFSPSNKLKLTDTEATELLAKVSEDTRIYQLTLQLVQKYGNLTEDIVQTNTKNLVNLVGYCLLNKSKLESESDETIKLISRTELINLIKKIEKDAKNYELTKEFSIMFTEHLLNKSQPEQLNKFNSFKKKDDPCDAWLQGRKYLSQY